MATVDRPVTAKRVGAGGSIPAPGPDRPLVKPPKPFFLRSWFALVLVLVLLAAHAYGWVKSQIQPELLITKAPDMQRMFVQLLQPDVISQDQKQLQISLPMPGVEAAPSQVTPATVNSEIVPVIRLAGETPQGPATSPGEVTDPTDPGAQAQPTEKFNASVTASSDTVMPGQQLTVSGTGLRPNTAGQLLWQSTGTNAFTQELGSFTTDGNGAFTMAANVPADKDRVVNSFGFPNTMIVSQTWNFGNMYPSSTLGLVIDKIIETVFLALMGTTFAIILSIPLSFLASRNLMPHTLLGTAVYTVARTILNILRSIEVLILAIIFAATVGLGPFAGVLALSVHSVASLGKLYSEAIESIDPGPIEAITATGANRLQVIMYAVVPQFIPQFISFTLYRWDINVRMSTVIGFVGGGGIGFILQQFINLGDYRKAATAIWAIAIVVIAMDWASAKIRARVI